MCKHQTLHSHSTTGSLQASVSPLASSSGGRLSAFPNCQCMRNAESGSNRVHLPWGPLFCAHRQIGLFFLLCSLELWVQVLVSFLVVVQFLGFISKKRRNPNHFVWRWWISRYSSYLIYLCPVRRVRKFLSPQARWVYFLYFIPKS